MLSQPLLWSLRVLAISAFIGVIAWQVVRRQAAANPEPVPAKAPTAKIGQPGSATYSPPSQTGTIGQPKQSGTTFLLGSKSYTGSATVDGGTLIPPLAPSPPSDEDVPSTIHPGSKSAPVLLPREVSPAKSPPASKPSAPPTHFASPKSGGLILPQEQAR